MACPPRRTTWCGDAVECKLKAETWPAGCRLVLAAPAAGVLAIDLAPSPSPVVWVAYFAPFSYEQHQDLIASCQLAKDLSGAQLCNVQVVGQSLDGRDIELVQVGPDDAKLKCWFVARQHPGETMAEWWMQGFLARLLDPADSLAAKLRSQATFYVVPNMNPDGSCRGHLRTNACGANLNREWASTGAYRAPTLQRSPEVYHVLEKLDQTGCDLFVDVHGDEELPHIFLASETGVPNWNDRHAELYRVFVEAQLQANPAFQLPHGYGTDKKGDANLAICAAQIAHRFDCLATTLEMPYKDS